MKKPKEKRKKDETKEAQGEELRRTFVHTSMLIHTNMPYTQLCYYTKTAKNTFTHRRFHTHTEAFTHRRFYTEAETSTHRPFYTDAFTHRR